MAKAKNLVVMAAVALLSAICLTPFGEMLWRKIGHPTAQKGVIPLIPVHSTWINGLCAFDGVRLSPSGRFGVLDRKLRSRTSLVSASKDIAVIDLDCEQGDATAQCVTLLEGLEGMRPLSWTIDEKSLYAVENELNLVRVSFGERAQMTRLEERLSINRELAETVNSVGYASGLVAIQEAARLEQRRASALRTADASSVPIGVYLNSARSLGAISFTSELDLVLVSEDRRIELGIKSPEPVSPEVTFRRGAAGLPIYSDVGMEIGTGKVAAIEPFSKPIVSSSDGALIGRFGRNHIDLSSRDFAGAPELHGAVAAALENSPGSFIQDVNTAGEAGFAFILKNLYGARQFAFSRNGRLIQHRCDASAENPAASVVDVALGTAKHPLFGLLVSQNSSRGMAVVFGGGPGGSSLNRPESFAAILKYHRLGYRVLAVNYSGSPGSGLETLTRLRVDGLEAVSKDAAAVTDYLRAHFPNERLVIHGESFGALPATSFASLNPGAPLVLVAPFLTHQDPEAWVSRASGPFHRISVRSQERAEKALLNVDANDDTELRRGMQRILGSRPATSPTLLVFARHDRVSQASHIPPSWTGNLTKSLVPGAHQFVAAEPETWKAIQAWLLVHDRNE